MFRHDARGPAANAYQMHQQMFSIGDDFWIEDSSGRRAFKVDGKALRLRKTMLLEDGSGRELYKIQSKLVTIRDVMEIEDSTGTVATVKKALISPLRARFDVDLRSGAKWEAHGNLVDHEYEIKGQAGPIAEVSKKWFRVRDTYGVEITPGQDDALVLAVAIVIDQMTHPAR